MEKAVVPGLAKLAVQCRWPLIHLPTAAEVSKTLGRKQIDVAVVHVSMDPQQSVEFIRWLRMTRRDVLLIAAATTHREEVERMVRNAGVHCYLPQADEATLTHAVAEALAHLPTGHDPGRSAHTASHDDAVDWAARRGAACDDNEACFLHAGLCGPASDPADAQPGR